VFGSVQEIKEKTGIEVTNLHKPYIDDVVYPNPDDPTGKTMMRRVSDVFDCWFESGSMPYAQIHYPFENKEWFENHFPADFIVEAIDQTRGWFYTLTVLSTALHHKPAFKNCICTGLLMAEGGQKLSKRLKNYPDPNDILETIGSDALRWFLISSPVLKGGNVAVDKEGKEIAKAARKALIPFWNAYYFFTLYANAEGIKAEEISSSGDVLDSYILAKLKALAAGVKSDMETYEIARACNQVEDFLEILNNWYIRRSRARFWDGEDKSAFNTLYTVLLNVAKIAAPLMPFMSEFVYKGLCGGESVHLTDVPNLSAIADNADLIAKMDMARAISSVAKAIREEHKLRNRLPLRSMIIAGDNAETLADFSDALKDEVNVKDVILKSDIADVAGRFLYLKTPLIGKRLGAHMKDIMAKSKTTEWTQNADGTLAIAGQTLFAEEYELRLVIKEGLNGQALPDNTAVVILDTTLDETLEKEGIARDFVRMIQALRKTKDFDISDRIRLAYSSDNVKVKAAITEYADYIKEQVLALEIKEDATLSTPTIDELGGSEIKFDVAKAA
jgi:isoleucyl-tRNA synthetase